MILVLFFLCFFTGFGVYSLIGKSVEASRERKHAEAQVLALQTKEEELSYKINALQTAKGREEAFREQFPVVSEGEEVVLITDPSVDESMNSSKETRDTGGFFQFLKNIFQ